MTLLTDFTSHISFIFPLITGNYNVYQGGSKEQRANQASGYYIENFFNIEFFFSILIT